jgi:hypothetical protein
VATLRAHLFQDLAPYVCTFDKCSKPDQIFTKRSDWWSHEFQHHRRDWSCDVSGHDVYDNSKDFEEHLRQKHPTWFVGPRIPTLLQMFARPNGDKEAMCPLCSDSVQDPDTAQAEWDDDEEPKVIISRVSVPSSKLMRHIARHLERLALFAIPPSYAIEGDAASFPTDQVHKDSRISDSDTESTNSIDSPPIGKCERKAHKSRLTLVNRYIGQ